MAYQTIDVTPQTVATPIPNDVITIGQEKEFVKRDIFSGCRETFLKINTIMNIYGEDDGTLDNSIPLTSVIYTPNQRFFENSKIYKQYIQNNSKLRSWLKKHNILVFVYGSTAYLDNSLRTQKTYNEASMLLDIIETSGCLASAYTCIPTVFKNDHYSASHNEDMINLIRFENSPFNHRLQTIRDRIRNVYMGNFTTINYLVFNDLNDEVAISRFMRHTINISLT